MQARSSLSTAASFESPLYSGYGFGWWHGVYEVGGRSVGCVFASGDGGNKLFLVPELGLVVVMLSSAYGADYGHPRKHAWFCDVLATVVR